MDTKSEQIRLRIKLSIAAYTYEYHNVSIMSDGDYDALSYKVNPQVTTGNRKLDNFFKKHFEPATGMWVRKHPEKHKLKFLYETFYKG